MVNRVRITFLVAEALFLLSGGLLIAFPLMMSNARKSSPDIDSIARNLILDRCPMTAAIANAILVFAASLTTVPALMMPNTRSWLKIQGYLVTISAFTSLIIGLTIWFDTLKTRSNLSGVWELQTPAVQSMLQQKFTCCGYMSPTNPEFVLDDVCRNNLVAAQMEGCVGPMSKFANDFLDLVFTAVFGVVGIDVLLILSITMLLKERKEQERYRYIDGKAGISGF